MTHFQVTVASKMDMIFVKLDAQTVRPAVSISELTEQF